MIDDRMIRGPAHTARVNINVAYEFAFWIKELHVTADRLRAAVHAVGNLEADVRAYLERAATRDARI